MRHESWAYRRDKSTGGLPLSGAASMATSMATCGGDPVGLGSSIVSFWTYYGGWKTTGNLPAGSSKRR